MPFQLTAQQQADLTSALQKITELKAEVARAKSAGIDTSVIEAQLADLEPKAKAMHAVYVVGKT